MYSNTFIAISVRPNRRTEFEYQSFGFLFGRIKIYTEQNLLDIFWTNLWIFSPNLFFSKQKNEIKRLSHNKMK